MYQVALIIGSLRKDSINKKLANAINNLSHPDITFSFIKIDDIPLYNQDLDSNLPASVVRFKSEIASADAVLFLTPEYNRSIPGVLKNIIDWGTRPYGQNVWLNKPVSIIGTSPSAVGTAVAQSHLRSIMVTLGSHVLGTPEVYLVYNDKLIDDSFNITVEGTKNFLQDYLNHFSKWLSKFK